MTWAKFPSASGERVMKLVPQAHQRAHIHSICKTKDKIINISCLAVVSYWIWVYVRQILGKKKLEESVDMELSFESKT